MKLVAVIARAAWPTHSVRSGINNRNMALICHGCLIPWFDGAILSQEWKEALWDKFVTGVL